MSQNIAEGLTKEEIKALIVTGDPLKDIRFTRQKTLAIKDGKLCSSR